MRIDPKTNPCKGLLAGAVGGLIACFAMSQFHSAFQKLQSSDQDKQEDSTVKTATAVSQRIFHHELTPQQKKIAGPAVHYGFGASIATFYGAAVEILPVLRTGWGMPFGVAVWLGAHVITLPAIGRVRASEYFDGPARSGRVWRSRRIRSGRRGRQAFAAKSEP